MAALFALGCRNYLPGLILAPRRRAVTAVSLTLSCHGRAETSKLHADGQHCFIQRYSC